MADNQAPTREEEDNELLTAYLDGELSDAENIAVEKRLAEDSEFHDRMLELQAAWDMLDSLPMIAKPDSQFVRTTVEMAITGHHRKRSFTSGLFKGLLLLLLPATAFGLSYFVKRESIEGPERELLNDLPVIENHERFTKVLYEDNAKDGINFLRSIYKKRLLREAGDLFAIESLEKTLEDSDLWKSPPANPQLIKERSDRVARMTDQQQAELFEKKKKFESLPENQQAIIREFHALLSNDPDRSNLVETLSTYYDWIKNLGPSQRARLLDLPHDKRLAEISRITRQQAEDAFGEKGSFRLPEDDIIPFYQWYDFSIRYYHQEIRERTGKVFSALQDYKGMPVTEELVQRIKAGPIEQLVEFMLRNDRDYLGNLLSKNSATEDVGVDLLRKFVSTDARSIVNYSEFDQRDQKELVLKWIETAHRSRFHIKSDAIKTFYEALPQDKRDKLDNQHPEHRHQELTNMYWEANIGQRSTASAEEDFEQFLRRNGLYTEFEFWEDEDAQ